MPTRRRGGDANTSRRVAAQRRAYRDRIIELYIKGWKLREIAEDVGASDASSISHTLTKALAEHAKESAELRDHAMHVMLERLEGLLSPLLKKVADTGEFDQKVYDTILKLFDRQIRIQGLDAPVKVDATVVTVDEADRQIIALAELIKSQGAKAGLPQEQLELPALEALTNTEGPQ